MLFSVNDSGVAPHASAVNNSRRHTSFGAAGDESGRPVNVKEIEFANLQVMIWATSQNYFATTVGNHHHPLIGDSPDVTSGNAAIRVGRRHARLFCHERCVMLDELDAKDMASVEFEAPSCTPKPARSKSAASSQRDSLQLGSGSAADPAAPSLWKIAIHGHDEQSRGRAGPKHLAHVLPSGVLIPSPVPAARRTWNTVLLVFPDGAAATAAYRALEALRLRNVTIARHEDVPESQIVDESIILQQRARELLAQQQARSGIKHGFGSAAFPNATTPATAASKTHIHALQSKGASISPSYPRASMSPIAAVNASVASAPSVPRSGRTFDVSHFQELVDSDGAHSDDTDTSSESSSASSGVEESWIDSERREILRSVFHDPFVSARDHIAAAAASSYDESIKEKKRLDRERHAALTDLDRKADNAATDGLRIAAVPPRTVDAVMRGSERLAQAGASHKHFEHVLGSPTMSAPPAHSAAPRADIVPSDDSSKRLSDYIERLRRETPVVATASPLPNAPAASAVAAVSTMSQQQVVGQPRPFLLPAGNSAAHDAVTPIPVLDPSRIANPPASTASKQPECAPAATTAQRAPPAEQGTAAISSAQQVAVSREDIDSDSSVEFEIEATPAKKPRDGTPRRVSRTSITSPTVREELRRQEAAESTQRLGPGGSSPPRRLATAAPATQTSPSRVASRGRMSPGVSRTVSSGAINERHDEGAVPRSSSSQQISRNKSPTVASNRFQVGGVLPASLMAPPAAAALSPGPRRASTPRVDKRMSQVQIVTPSREGSMALPSQLSSVSPRRNDDAARRCKWCKNVAPESHGDRCALRKIKCKKCGEVVLLRDRTSHVCD